VAIQSSSVALQPEHEGSSTCARAETPRECMHAPLCRCDTAMRLLNTTEACMPQPRCTPACIHTADSLVRVSAQLWCLLCERAAAGPCPQVVLCRHQHSATFDKHGRSRAVACGIRNNAPLHLAPGRRGALLEELAEYAESTAECAVVPIQTCLAAPGSGELAETRAGTV
jgi:hypothetical protein